MGGVDNKYTEGIKDKIFAYSIVRKGGLVNEKY